MRIGHILPLLASLFLCGCMQEKTVLTLSTDRLSFSGEAGTQTVTVQSNAEWTPSCRVEWVKTEANGSSLTVTVQANMSSRARSAEIFVSAGSINRLLTVSQDLWEGVLVAKTEYDLGYDGGVIDLEIESGISYTLEPTVPWIAKDKSKGNRFIVKESDELTPREGSILVKDEKKQVLETITVRQDEGHTFFSEGGVFNVSREGGTVEIPVNTTVDVTYNIINGDGWVELTQTKAVQRRSFTFSVSPNETKLAREATIQILSSDTDKTEEISIVQEPGFLPLVFTYSGNFFTLPVFNPEANGYVLWGDDGSSELNETSHNYSGKGPWKIEVWTDAMEFSLNSLEGVSKMDLSKF